MHCSNNHLRICKYIEERGEMKKPHEQDVFHIVVESCSQRRYYILNKSNCFCVELDHLCNETYCVYEENGDEEYEVSYMVDGHDCQEACVNFNQQDFHHVKVINHKKCRTGTLCIKKRVFDVCGKEVHSDDSFTVKVRGLQFEKTVTLDRRNHFKVCIEDLPFGSYEVKEKRNDDYDVTYVVDGVEKERGIISVEEGKNLIEVHNHMNNGTHFLRICKWLMVDGKLKKPDYHNEYTIVLRDHYACKEYTLSCENHFCVCIEGDKHDTFILEELDAHHVIYEVNGEEVEQVEVTLDSDYDVRIINVEGPCPDPDPEDTGLQIRKWIEKDGQLSMPSHHQHFTFTIQGYSEEEFVLDSSNDFMLQFSDMREGYYCIHETNNTKYNVVYEVNGERQEDGYVFVNDDEISMVNMINQKICPPITRMLHLIKRVNSPCSHGDVVPPSEGCYTICVNVNNEESYYELNADNDYEMMVPIQEGKYIIYEIPPQTKVTYQLDGVNCKDEVVFMAQNKSYEVVIINYVNKVNFVI